MFEKLIGKKGYESLTVWGLGVFGLVFAAEQSGIIPPGTSTALEAVAETATSPDAAATAEQVTRTFGDVANAIGGLLVVLGLRRAAGG